MTEPSANRLSYGELLRLTQGHGTSEIYKLVSDLRSWAREAHRQMLLTHRLFVHYDAAETEACDTCAFLARAPEGVK